MQLYTLGESNYLLGKHAENIHFLLWFCAKWNGKIFTDISDEIFLLRGRMAAVCSCELFCVTLLLLCVFSKLLGNVCSWSGLTLLHTSVCVSICTRNKKNNRLAMSGWNFLCHESLLLFYQCLSRFSILLLFPEMNFSVAKTPSLELWKPMDFEIYTLIYVVLWDIGSWAWTT